MADLISSSRNGARITQRSRVRLHFAVLLESGEEVDTTRRGKPATFEFGDGNLLPGFEAALLGMRAGDDAQLVLPAEEAFGLPRQENIRLIPRQQFSEIDLEPGLLVSFASPSGELPGTVRQVLGEQVEVDFNHPLAGRKIVFDVSILEVGVTD